MPSLTGDAKEFHRLLNALASELVDARIHLKFHQDLSAAVPEYATEFNQCITFWNLTFSAQIDAVLLRLCKAYDQYGDKPTLHLSSLLETISSNMHLFDEPNFRERLKNNAFVDSLAAVPRKPDAAQLQKDIASVSKGNHLVKKLIAWRNNFYSHFSSDRVLNAGEFERNNPLSMMEIETLSSNGLEIINRYSELFAATVHSSNIVGRKDYLWLLEAAREAVQSHEARVEAEFKHLTR